MGTGCCCDGGCRSVAIASTATTAATATATAAISRDRGGPSALSSAVGATWATLGSRSIGDGTGQGAGDARDLLNARDDAVAQMVVGIRLDADHDVIGAGDVLGGAHARQPGQLLGDDLGAADIGLDQHESLDHPGTPPFRCIDSTPQGPKVPQVRGLFSARTGAEKRAEVHPELRQGDAMADEERADSLAGLG